MPRFAGSPTALRVAQTARAWRVQSPATTYLHVDDAVRAYLLDEAMATRLQVEDRRQQARAEGKAVLPPDQRYSVEADYDDAGQVAGLAKTLAAAARAPETAQDGPSGAQGADIPPDSPAGRLLAERP